MVIAHNIDIFCNSLMPRHPTLTLGRNPQYDWLTPKVCNEYERTWEISSDEVHYGWLSSGEQALRLLNDVPEGSSVLDAGCGMGENVIALRKMNLKSYGLDISPHMLRKARKKLREQGFSDVRKCLKQCDVREIASSFKSKFQAIIAVYSLDFLPNIQEFRQSIDSVSRALDENGSFIMAISHPTAHPNYPQLSNNTMRTSEGALSVLIYSVRDAVSALCDYDMTIERIVEQQTMNPSQISYEEGQRFPYHFHQGRNPCAPLFDPISNKNPHSIIYKVKKRT